MSQRIVVILSSITLGLFILFTSASKASQSSLISTPRPNSMVILSTFNNSTSSLGFAMPGSILWPFKAFKEQILIETAFNLENKFDLMVGASSTRMNLAGELFNLHNPEVGLSTLSKSEKYLERASRLEEDQRLVGKDTIKFLSVLQTTAKIHQEKVEAMVLTAPEEVRPLIIKESNISRRIYQNSSRLLGHNPK